MDLHEEDWFEETLMPLFTKFRYLLAIIEVFALGYY
jgi:hypothetical protein